MESRSVGGYVARRLAQLALVWLGITILAFGLANLAPGDPAEMILLRRTGLPPTESEVRVLRRELGLDAPVHVRYLRWAGGAVTGDLGRSYQTDEAVVGALATRLPATLELAAASLALALLLALPLGVLSAVRRGAPVDHATRVLALLGASLPSFWLAYVLILLFAVQFRWLPVAGRGGWEHLVLPALTLALGASARLARLVRASMLEELGQDYVRTARAKGLSRSAVVVRHALRNALNPLVTLTGMQFGALMAGAVIVETIFAWPGIGRLLVEAIYDRDYPVIQGFVLFTGTVFVLVNFLVDLSYPWLDPRVRLARAEGTNRG